MYQVLWSASFCQLSYLPCIKYFGLPVSVSWVTFHVSSTLVCQFLSAEVPSMYQVLWSASFCQLSYLPCIKYFGLPASFSWVTFHVSVTLVCQFLSAELPSMYQVLWPASSCQLHSLKKRHRRRESSFGIGLKGMCISSVSLDRLVGLVVKASASRAEDPGFESRLRRVFSRSSHTSDLKIDTPVATLTGAWHYRVSAGTGRPGVSILWLGEVESWLCNFYLSVAARKTVLADPSLRYTSMLLGR